MPSRWHLPSLSLSAMSAPQPLLSESEMDEESPISLESVLVCVRRFWLLLLLSAAVGAGLAYYLAGRQMLQYSKTASVMLRDAKSGIDTSSDRIMQELGVDSSASNLANESCILKSTSLMVRTVESLGVNTTYWHHRGFRFEELYKDTPLLVEFSGCSEDMACVVSVTPTDADSYSIEYKTTSGDIVREMGQYREPLQLPFACIAVHPTSKMNDSCIGVPVQVRHTSTLMAAQALLRNLSVSRPADAKDSSLLELTLLDTNPHKTADILDKLVEVYNQNSRDAKGESARRTEAFIRGRLAELGADLNDVDVKIATQRIKDDVVTSAEQSINVDYSTTQAITQEIFNLQTQLKLADALMENLNNAGRNVGLIALDSGVADSSISSILQGYNEAYLQYQRVSGSAGAKNPVVVTLKDKMSSSLAAAKRAVENYKHNTQLKIKELQVKQASLDERITKTSEHEQTLTPLVREHKVKEELYMLLLKKEQENALSLALAMPSAMVLETAHGSDMPVAPNTRMFLVLGSGGGFALCMLSILGIGMLNNKIKTRREIVNKTSLPVLAELPHLSRKERKGMSSNYGLISDERSRMAECLHILRNNVESLVPRESGRGLVLMLTSTIPGEGKTFISANLAATFAKVGRRVLLIDFDIRKRSLSHNYGGKGRKGVSSLLLNQVEDVNMVVHQMPNTAYKVDVIYAGPAVPNPVTLLTQPKVAQLLNEARSFYDVIMLDCPPYNVLADTAILAPHCDAVLYFVRSGLINRNIISAVQKLVDSRKLPPLGYVVNDVDFRAAGHQAYGYNYRYAYRYGAREDKEESSVPAKD